MVIVEVVVEVVAVLVGVVAVVAGVFLEYSFQPQFAGAILTTSSRLAGGQGAR